MDTNSPSAARAIPDGLPGVLQVFYRPLRNAVAQLDTSKPTWVLYLDSDSPAEDQWWVMLDVVRILVHGVEAAESAVCAPLLSLVRD